MSTFEVERLTFAFDPTVTATRYDSWQHHVDLNRQQQGTKGVDLVVVVSENAPEMLYLIEAKDFRIITSPPDPSNLQDLPKTVLKKVKDTQAGLVDAAANAAVASERDFAQLTLRTQRIRVVLHLEPHPKPRLDLFPKNFRASVYQRLKQAVGSIDSHPLVLSIKDTRRAGVPWSVN